MVLPGDELSVQIRHVGMRNGRMVIKVEVLNDRGNKVLEGSAEVEQPTTPHVLIDHGSQEAGMGMEPYTSFVAWETADEHLLALCGFSIFEKVKMNTKDNVIHFGRIKGLVQTIRHTGKVKTLPLFGVIDVLTLRYISSHQNSLLFVTQFAQTFSVTTEKAAFEGMRNKGFAPNDCSTSAGRSLGECSSLRVTSVADGRFYAPPCL